MDIATSVLMFWIYLSIDGRAGMQGEETQTSGFEAERDPRRNGMDSPFGDGPFQPFQLRLAVLTGTKNIIHLRVHFLHARLICMLCHAHAAFFDGCFGLVNLWFLLDGVYDWQGWLWTTC